MQPLPKKVEALQNIAPPKNKKQLQGFLGMKTVVKIPQNGKLLSQHVDLMIGSPCTTDVPYIC